MALSAQHDALTVSFDVTRADLEAGVARQLRGIAAKGSILKTFLMLLLVFIVVGFMVFNAGRAGAARWTLLGIYAIFAGWLLLWFLRVNRNPVPRVVDQVIAKWGEEAVIGPEHITISATGVRSDHGHCTLMHRWLGVKAIEESDEGLLITTDTTIFYRIPRRAFANDAAMHEFAQHALMWQSAARQAPGATEHPEGCSMDQ